MTNDRFGWYEFEDFYRTLVRVDKIVQSALMIIKNKTDIRIVLLNKKTFQTQDIVLTYVSSEKLQSDFESFMRVLKTAAKSIYSHKKLIEKFGFENVFYKIPVNSRTEIYFNMVLNLNFLTSIAQYSERVELGYFEMYKVFDDFENEKDKNRFVSKLRKKIAEIKKYMLEVK